MNAVPPGVARVRGGRGKSRADCFCYGAKLGLRGSVKVFALEWDSDVQGEGGHRDLGIRLFIGLYLVGARGTPSRLEQDTFWC